MSQEQPNRLRNVAMAAGAVLALTIVLLYMLGIFGDKTAPGTVKNAGTPVPSGAVTAKVEKRIVDDVLAWPGTVRSRTVTQIAPKLTARIQEIKVDAGDRVNKGDVIALLDPRDLRAREQEARAALAAARAEAARAAADERRTQGLFAKEAATEKDLETAVAQARSARAQVEQAANALEQARVMLGETRLMAPFDGVVVKRHQEPGDMGMPGGAVVTLQDPVGLRLEAYIPTSCAGQMEVGMEAVARIDAVGEKITGSIDEIEPEADPETRTVLVKLALPATPGLQPGLFGWLEQACEQHIALLIPQAAVTRIGQIETVRVQIDDRLRMRHIRTGKRFDDKFEVLSGLREGESVIIIPR